MKKEKYIADGRFFKSFDDVVAYAASKKLRVANTETIKGVILITLNAE